MQVACLAKDIHIVKEPIQQVETARYYVRHFQERVRIASVDDLDPLELKQWLKDAEQLSCLSDTF